MEPTRPIRFVHRGRIVEAAGLPPTTSVLAWLREHAGQTGTKEGCNEGDCGACTVIVAERADPDLPAARGAARSGGLLLRPVNACIRFLPTLDGKALLTVEDLKRIAGPAASPDGDAPLHPVQQALVDHHGSQCGFCTPGFAMTLAALYERHCEAGTRPSRRDCADALAGNLCRCTGYRPILDAAQAMFELPAVRLDAAPLADALQLLAQDPPLHYRGPSAAGDGTLQSFHAPRTLAAFAALREARPQARLLGGGTDVGLWVNKQFRDLGEILAIGEVAELKRIDETGGVLRIGAAVPLEDAWERLAERVPALRELWLRFAGPPVRHVGTLVGNLANGSPIGDAAPALMCLDARLLLRRGGVERHMPLEDFYTGYMANRLQPGEFVQAVEVPLPPPGLQLRAWKLGKRYDCDISGVCAGLALALDDDGRVRDVRFAFGGMAAVVRRATAAEAAVRDRPWTEDTVAAAVQALAADFTPLTDLRASAAYRLKSASGLLRRLWLETRRDAPLAPAQASVWAELDEERAALEGSAP